MGAGSQRHAPTALFPGKIPGIHLTGGRVGPRVGLDECGEEQISRSHRIVEPIGSLYVEGKSSIARIFDTTQVVKMRNYE